ncbi:zinc-dependent alcohol dehydrogenase family protein [Roseicyclus mahoneyensis]|uniref:NADPH:quinone reductase-like Zn-dependent oxidoreductase n=1 Tax=Roseicyclus mahoneyensis TaxID=164332 RepID=A0A316GNJ5_9RHOB|nr:NAD(P)-dependent alcohol dehydrogenase [Roseicyclus mahoneyensis]PWK61023.1 NADPH:quinone reductase-like Zn-dependent oxidoreductase [Roseicyclus mahoneyensis]
MKAWRFEGGFGFENLRLVELPDPVPGAGEVLLEMRAAALNYRDLVVLRGQHGRRVQPPLIPLSDGVGVVAATGPGVTGLPPGTRVCPAFFQHWDGGPPPDDLEAGRLGGPLDGVLATACVFPAATVVPVPDHLSDAEAATLPCAGLTAWSALMAAPQICPGEVVLVLGTGGVALMAVQLAKAAGARVIVTTSTPERAAQVAGLGADLVIDRGATPDWAACVRAATDGMGADRVLELGGAATLPDTIRCTRVGGQIILIGNVTGNRAEIFLPAILTRQLTLRAVTVGSRQGLAALSRAIGQHGLRPVVGQTLPFAKAPDAFRILETQSVFGNICIRIGD